MTVAVVLVLGAVLVALLLFALWAGHRLGRRDGFLECWHAHSRAVACLGPARDLLDSVPVSVEVRPERQDPFTVPASDRTLRAMERLAAALARAGA